MEYDSEFRRLANRNKFIEDLERQGYEVDFVGNYLVIYGLPYLDHKGNLRYGDVASPVDLKNEYEIDTPSTHQIWFSGEVPYGVNGGPLPISAVSNQREITPDLKCLLSFSLKLTDDSGRSENTKASRKRYAPILRYSLRQRAKSSMRSHNVELRRRRRRSTVRYAIQILCRLAMA